MEAPDSISGLLDEAYEILFLKKLGVNHAEDVFIKILDVLKHDPIAKDWFVLKSTAQILSGGQVIMGEKKRPSGFVDEDLIYFIAHATKWDFFFRACEQRKLSKAYLKKLDWSRDYADYLNDALSPNWEDREFYKYFSD